MLPFKLFCSSNFTIDCIKCAPVRIFEADNRKQYLPIRLPIFFKACGIIYSYDPIKICRHLFRAWVSFLKMNSPLSWLLWERIFNLKGGGGHFLDIFQKYKFISPKRLIMHCIFFFTIVQLFNCSRRKVTLKGYLERQKAMPKRSWPSFNMWRVGSETGLLIGYCIHKLNSIVCDWL